MDTLTSQLEQLENAQLVRRAADEVPAYVFEHALTQEAAYESLLVKKRREIHRRVAEAYERLYADRLDEFVALLAQHYSQAGDDAKIAKYAIRAGDKASRLNALTVARLYYALALDSLERLPENDENRRQRMETLANQVRISEFADEPAQNLARLDEAEALAKQLIEGDPTIRRHLSQIYQEKGAIHQVQNEPREALRYYHQAHAVAQDLADDGLMARPTFSLGLVLSFQGRFAEAEPLYRDSIRLMDPTRMPLECSNAVGNLGRTLAAQGFYAEGLAEAQRGLTLAQQANHPTAIEISYAVLAETYLMGRDLLHMVEASHAAVETAEASHDIVFIFWGLVYLAWAQSYLDQHQAARENMARAGTVIQMFQGQVPRSELVPAVEAEIALNANQYQEAQARAEQAVSLARTVDSIYSESLAQRVWGQALVRVDHPRFDQADEHFADSLRLFQEGGARLEAARTHVLWGQVLRARGQTEAARQHFEKAAAQFQISGLTGELEEAKRLIDSLPV